MAVLSKVYLTAISAALAIGSIANSAAAVSLYSITDVGSFTFNPVDLNDSGQIIGNNGLQSFLWENGTTTDLTSMGASAINNLGQIAGVKDGQLFIRESDGTINNLGLPQCASIDSLPCSYKTVSGINNAGQILGMIKATDDYTYNSYLFRRELQGYIQVLVPFYGFIYRSRQHNIPNIYGAALNAQGQSVYTTRSGVFYGVAILSEMGITDGTTTTRIIGSYPVLISYPNNSRQEVTPNPTEIEIANSGLFSSITNSYPIVVKDINNQGEIVGTSNIYHDSPDFYRHATLFPNPGTAIYLGSLGGNYSEANAINDLTQIVGWAENANRQKRSFIWENNQMFDLNDLLVNGEGWQITSANLINNNQQIVGTGIFNGEWRTVLLNPVNQQSIPEPSTTLGLLALGVFATIRFRR